MFHRSYKDVFLLIFIRVLLNMINVSYTLVLSRWDSWGTFHGTFEGSRKTFLSASPRHEGVDNLSSGAHHQAPHMFVLRLQVDARVI